MPLHDDTAPPEHIRWLTSRHVLDVEADLVTRLAARGNAAPQTGERAAATVDGLDAGQRAAVTALVGDAGWCWSRVRPAPGRRPRFGDAGGDWTGQSHRLLVVTPTLKAAQAATLEVGAAAGSAAWLVYQHGWRWDEAGRWTGRPGEIDPVPAGVPGPGEEVHLRQGDLAAGRRGRHARPGHRTCAPRDR